ncbi:MAG: amidohydrolase family protein [Isosphaeraceae bacterium]
MPLGSGDSGWQASRGASVSAHRHAGGVRPRGRLKAMTIWAAEQHGEDASKGSLEPGKLADLVVLDRNPPKVEPMPIRDVCIEETLKEGEDDLPPRSRPVAPVTPSSAGPAPRSLRTDRSMPTGRPDRPPGAFHEGAGPFPAREARKAPTPNASGKIRLPRIFV